MHLTTLLTLALTATLTTAKTNEQICASKAGSDFVGAINAFCDKTNIVVPSPYGNAGKVVGNAKVRITGKCKPAQWVPSYWCRVQMMALCASNPDNAGLGIDRAYGKNGCQFFEISGKDSGFAYKE